MDTDDRIADITDDVGTLPPSRPYSVADAGNVHARFAANIGRALHARVIRELGSIVSTYSNLLVVCVDNLITIDHQSSHGVPIAISTSTGRYRVALGEWEEELANVREVVTLIDAALRGAALKGEVRMNVRHDAGGSRAMLDCVTPAGQSVNRAARPRSPAFTD